LNHRSPDRFRVTTLQRLSNTVSWLLKRKTQGPIIISPSRATTSWLTTAVLREVAGEKRIFHFLHFKVTQNSVFLSSSLEILNPGVYLAWAQTRRMAPSLQNSSQMFQDNTSPSGPKDKFQPKPHVFLFLGMKIAGHIPSKCHLVRAL
jgi:hypothetical protein